MSRCRGDSDGSACPCCLPNMVRRALSTRRRELSSATHAPDSAARSDSIAIPERRLEQGAIHSRVAERSVDGVPVTTPGWIERSHPQQRRIWKRRLPPAVQTSSMHELVEPRKNVDHAQLQHAAVLQPDAPRIHHDVGVERRRQRPGAAVGRAHATELVTQTSGCVCGRALEQLRHSRAQFDVARRPRIEHEGTIVRQAVGVHVPLHHRRVADPGAHNQARDEIEPVRDVQLRAEEHGMAARRRRLPTDGAWIARRACETREASGLLARVGGGLRELQRHLDSGAESGDHGSSVPVSDDDLDRRSERRSLTRENCAYRRDSTVDVRPLPPTFAGEANTSDGSLRRRG